MRRKRKTNEHKKRRQAIASGLPAHTGHRSHVSAGRWLRPWAARLHQQEMKVLKKHFENGGGIEHENGRERNNMDQKR